MEGERLARLPIEEDSSGFEQRGEGDNFSGSGELSWWESMEMEREVLDDFRHRVAGSGGGKREELGRIGLKQSSELLALGFGGGIIVESTDAPIFLNGTGFDCAEADAKFFSQAGHSFTADATAEDFVPVNRERAITHGKGTVDSESGMCHLVF